MLGSGVTHSCLAAVGKFGDSFTPVEAITEALIFGKTMKEGELVEESLVSIGVGSPEVIWFRNG